jgi:hypothetical protein
MKKTDFNKRNGRLLKKYGRGDKIQILLPQSRAQKNEERHRLSP